MREEQVDQASNAGSRGVTESRLRHPGYLDQGLQAPAEDPAQARLKSKPAMTTEKKLDVASGRPNGTSICDK